MADKRYRQLGRGLSRECPGCGRPTRAPPPTTDSMSTAATGAASSRRSPPAWARVARPTWIVEHGGVEAGRGPGRPAGGGRAAPVRARALALPLPRAGRRPAGPDPPARDRAGGRGGADRTGPIAGGRAGRRSDWTCADLGTGSGAIALSLAVEGGPPGPDLEVWATDVSADALAVAAPEPGRAGADRSRCRRSGAAGPRRLVRRRCPDRVAGRLDLVVSNPPYVAESEYPTLDPVVRDWEPRRALVAGRGTGGVGGMAAIEAIVAGAPRWLRPSGVLVVEIAPSQARAAVDARPPGRIRPVPVPHRTWPAGSACWWPGADHGQLCATRAIPGRSSLAAAALAQGAVVALPTDTVYGLAADPSLPEAVARLFSLKDRPADVALPSWSPSRAPGRRGGRPTRLGGPAPGRSVLARTPHAGGPRAATASRPTWAALRPPARRWACGCRTMRWFGRCAPRSAHWP